VSVGFWICWIDAWGWVMVELCCGRGGTALGFNPGAVQVLCGCQSPVQVLICVFKELVQHPQHQGQEAGNKPHHSSPRFPAQPTHTHTQDHSAASDLMQQPNNYLACRTPPSLSLSHDATTHS
jgi:hypothetical protein